MSDAHLAAERKQDALRHALGATVLEALADPQVVEVMANPDGRLVIDRQGIGRLDTGVRLGLEARERAIRLVAEHVGEPITRDDPRLAGSLPTGERFQAFFRQSRLSRPSPSANGLHGSGPWLSTWIRG